MMMILIIALKAALVVSLAVTANSIRNLYKNDTGVRIKFDWLSWLNISGCVGLCLVSLLAVINKNTYLFTAALLVITICLTYFIKARLVIAGDSKVLLGTRCIDRSAIRKIRTGLMTMYADTDQGTIRVYAPISERSVITKLYKAAGKEYTV